MTRLPQHMATPPRLLPAMSRDWSMPSADTFTIPAIAKLLDRWLDGRKVIVDPFARNSRRGNITNDLNPKTAAQDHLPADLFAENLVARGVHADAVLLDPPYSPRQIKECYSGIGLNPTQADTQLARLLAAVKDHLAQLMVAGGIAITFGWNSSGFGLARGFELLELLCVCHGGQHNDTIITVERKLETLFCERASA